MLTLIALVLWSGSASAQGNTGTLLTTFTNPTPADYGLFGSSLAALTGNRVLVGAEGAGAAYLFNSNGTLLTTFTDPSATFTSFGASVAAVGGERVLVGAYGYKNGAAQVGRAYLFNTNGALLTTFTNPSPSTVQAFGWSVAGMDGDRVLIGTGGRRAYLFRTNGNLLTTFTNPVTEADGGFGVSVAGVGSDRVLIGAPYDSTGAATAGIAYLFNTNGVLLTTFTQPSPQTGDNFGSSVAAVGSDRILIGAEQDSLGAQAGEATYTSGAAYLFSTNGVLLTTFANPIPTPFGRFGRSLAGVGNSRVLIGAYQDATGEFQAGAAYLFSTNGALLMSFTNPTPARQDWFAWSVAAMGNDRVLIGGVWDDTGAPDSGAAYLFDLPYPKLGIARSASTVSIQWVTTETGLSLQESGLLGTSTAWEDTVAAVAVNGPTNVVQLTLGSTNRFFRLGRP